VLFVLHTNNTQQNTKKTTLLIKSEETMAPLPRRLTRRQLLRISGLALGYSLISACTPAAPAAPKAEEQSSETKVEAAADSGEAQPAADSTATTAPAELAAAPTATTAPAAEAIPTKPANRPFIASDPAAFVQAAGKPQLVEFYATW
jgi:hypothetical protein